jgi:tRNA nucleotidyltransferase/poly(A) polymerase
MEIKKYIDFILEKKINVDMPLPNDVIEISNAYRKAHKKLFVVGGAVRDFLQGKNPHDYDLVTNALPEESKQILKDFNVSDEQGKNFGVLRVYTKSEPLGYEIASYRKDISKGRDTKGNDDKVELGSHVTIKDDCMRRDLTINALFYDIIHKQVVDIVGGVNDIKRGIVRAVGDPEERFLEDRLRILRVFRFTSRTGGKIDSHTSSAIRRDNRLRGIGPKDDVSQERIWEEINKAWEHKNTFNKYLELLTEFNMWPQIFPGSNINTKLINTDNFIIIIANLFKNENINGLVERMVQEYKIKNDTSVLIVFLISLLNFNPEDVLQYYRKKEQIIDAYIKGVESERVKYKKRLNELIIEWFGVNNIHDKLLFKFLDYTPTVSSQDLMNQGFHGHRLGVELRRLETENFLKM